MSTDNAKRFFEKIDSDAKLQKQIAKAETNLLAIAKRGGFECSASELREALRERYAIKAKNAPKDAFTLR